jgi:two-component system sensor histidine kinase KdpD
MEDSLSKKDRQELIATAIEEAERLNQSISNILHMTKIESGDMKANTTWLDVHSLFSDSAARLATLLDKRSITIDVPNNALAVSVDPVLFPQVLQNLLENIAKYTPETSAVKLSTRIHSRKIELHISDSGPGVPEQEQIRLFDKFSRLESRDARVAGTGLGLSICKAIVELHGGTIALKNNTNEQGLSVIITLPKYRKTENEIGV